MRSSLTLLSIVALLAVSLSVAGCGLKGDLYIPESGPSESSASSDDDDNGENDAADS